MTIVAQLPCFFLFDFHFFSITISQLIGDDPLFSAMKEPWVSQQLSNNVAIYATAYYDYRNGAMPQLIIGTNITSGVLPMDKLFNLLSTQFGLHAAPPAP